MRSAQPIPLLIFHAIHATIWQMSVIVAMTAERTIRVGSRVYLHNCVAGEPGCVVGFVRGKAKVLWPDLPEVGRHTFHAIDALELDAGFTVRQIGFDWDPVAA